MPASRGMTAAAVLIAVPVIAVLLQRYNHLLFSGVDAPPSDYGSGSMFDLIAARYDMVNRVLAMGMDIGWRKRMVRAIRDGLEEGADVTKTGARVLDLATGTADVGILLAEEMPYADVVGVDPSHRMLDIGRDKIRKAGLEKRVHLQYADARDLRYENGVIEDVQKQQNHNNRDDDDDIDDDAKERTSLVELSESSFDGATMAFGIRNVPEKDVALCEVHRVLKPNGKFCILEFSEPEPSSGPLKEFARVFIRHVVPFLGGVLSGKPREYWHLQNSIKDFPSPKEFANFIENLRCPTGSYVLEELVQMNFDSVQLYITKTVRPQTPQEKEEESQR